MNNPQKGSATNTILIILIAVFAILAVYFAFIKKPIASVTPQSTTVQTQPMTTTPTPVTPPAPISTTLPSDVRDGLNSWPPVITNSTNTYSCTPTALHGDGNNQTIETVVNGRTYCVSTSSDGYAGGAGITYTYTTPATNGIGTETTTFTLLYTDCGVYGDTTSPQYNQCKTNETTFNSNLSALIDSLITK